MPRVGISIQDTTDRAGDIGRAILSFLKSEPDHILDLYQETNSKGLFIVLKTGEKARRAIVIDADQPHDNLDSVEELKLRFGRLPESDRSKLLDSLGLMHRPTPQADPALPITSVFDLKSIFDEPKPVEYLIELVVPVESVVYLAGLPESGKSTLACAFGRDLAAKGHGVLLIDRDRNPRSVIRDRLKRLGVHADDRFKVWDSQQNSQPPQPDDVIVIDWVRRVRLETGKSALVIVDSAVSFLRAGEEENSSQDIRAFFNRCRAVVDAGGSVLVLHHLGKSGDLRGSSDFGAAADQGFIVKNSAAGRHRLDLLTLTVDKTRYALSECIVYKYDGGRMVREPAIGTTAPAGGSDRPTAPHIKSLIDLLKANPRVGTRAFEEIARSSGIPHNKARTFLREGRESGKITTHSAGKKLEHNWVDGCDE